MTWGSASQLNCGFLGELNYSNESVLNTSIGQGPEQKTIFSAMPTRPTRPQTFERGPRTQYQFRAASVVIELLNDLLVMRIRLNV